MTGIGEVGYAIHVCVFLGLVAHLSGTLSSPGLHRAIRKYKVVHPDRRLLGSISGNVRINAGISIMLPITLSTTPQHLKRVSASRPFPIVLKCYKVLVKFVL